MRRILAGLVVLSLFSVAMAEAQDGGSRSIFAQGAGNRALGMGGAYSSVADDASAPLWNPGGLGLVPRYQFQATRTSLYGLDMSEEFVGLVLPSWKWGTFAATFRHFGAGAIDGRDERNFETDDFSTTDSQITLSYGKQWSEAWSLGATAKLQSQSVGQGSAAGLGFDVGLIAFPELILGDGSPISRRLSVGLTIRNLVEPSLKLDEESVADPMAARLGVSYRHPLGDGGRYVMAAMDLERARYSDLDMFVGLEAQVHRLLVLRTGLQQGSPTVGTRVSWRDFSLDYAFENNSLGGLHRFGLSVGFGATVAERRLAARQMEEEILSARLEEGFAMREHQRVEKLLDQAETAYKKGSYDQSLDLITALTVLSPGLPEADALQIRCLIGQAQVQESARNFADAAVAFGRVLASDPDNAEALAGRDRCRQASNLRAERSIEMQQLFSQGLDALTAGDLITARSHFTEILERTDDPEAETMLDRIETAAGLRVLELLEQARLFREAGSFKKAAASLAEANTLMPASNAVLAAMGELSRAKSRAKQAVREQETKTVPAPAPRTLTAAQRIKLESFYKDGLVAMESGRVDDAVRYWEWAYSLDPGYLQVADYLKREYLLKGMEVFSSGQWDDAIVVWSKALEIDPQDEKTQVYLNRARQQVSRTREIMGITGQ